MRTEIANESHTFLANTERINVDKLYFKERPFVTKNHKALYLHHWITNKNGSSSASVELSRMEKDALFFDFDNFNYFLVVSNSYTDYYEEVEISRMSQSYNSSQEFDARIYYFTSNEKSLTVNFKIEREPINSSPRLNLNTLNNLTLYENDTLSIGGTTLDVDVGDTVTVKYQINNGTVRTLSTAISNGASLPFNKNLTFKNKRLYDGATVVSDELGGGTQHTLKVWVEDNNGGKSTVQTRSFQVVPNRPPTITLSTDNYQTLYERDTLLIYGSTKDVDNGDSVTVRYQINSGTVRNLHSAISDSSTDIPFSKELTYSDGVLKDGNTVLTSALDEGSPHTLSVWSEDGNGGKSSVQSRTFHVVPNRPPVVSVNPIAHKSDLIPSETIEISGNVSDLDDNDVTITFAINDGPTQSVREGAPGPFSFNVMLKDLDVGSNRITIKAKDIYQAEVVKIVTINKIHDAVPINQAVALYKVNPPSGDAQKILLWIERQLGDLAVTAEVSMTNEGEPENFVSIERTNSELKGMLQEDEFAYDAHENKTNIIIKIVYNRNDSESQETIKKISGVLA